MITIDGSYGEGGGQILRMSIAISALMNEPIKIFNIRANRPNPGLKRQHITGVEAVAKLSDAEVKGLHLGSKSIEFYPHKIKGGNYKFNIGTAGSITLVMQACLLPSIAADDEVYFKITGGTDVKWAPPWDYFQNVFLALLKKMGCRIEAYLNQRGYYPAGGGEAEILIEPCKPKPVNFDEAIEKINGIVNIANLPSSIAERIKNSAEEELKKNGFKPSISIEETSTNSEGVGIVLWSEPKILGADCLGERGKKAEQVGKEAAEKLIKEINSKADIDERAVDQILPYLAIANKGRFRCRKITKHASTEMWLIKKFIDIDFKIEKINGLYEVEVVK